MFRHIPGWLGGDGAHSVDLGSARTLWLFGDSFVDPREGASRRAAVMVRNTIAVQTGSNPETAEIQAYWKRHAGAPGAFFETGDDTWFWPGHAVCTRRHLLVFLMRIGSADNALGFAYQGWEALRVDNFRDRPDQWRISSVKTQLFFPGMAMGAAGILSKDGFVYAYCPEKNRRRAVYLARWPIERIADADLSRPQWWAGQKDGWTESEKSGKTPVPIFFDGQMEFTVHYEKTINRFIEIQTIGFGAAELVYRSAPNPWGPWTPPKHLFHPPENRIPGVLVYAAAAHPQLANGGFAATYIVSHADPQRILDENGIYFPRFLSCSVAENTRLTGNGSEQFHPVAIVGENFFPPLYRKRLLWDSSIHIKAAESFSSFFP